ncbi:MAG TPA: OPT/YSL family transporter, partial [Myxococcaceae bacterium]|nr:OPT/YSL family transporter [Myxococcaceae bacterium]
GGAALAPGLGGVLALAVIGGTVLTWGERWPFAPSAVAMGVGFLIPASYATALCAGALLAVAARRTLGAEADARLPSVAAGVITGEAVAGVAAVTLAALMPAST